MLSFTSMTDIAGDEAFIDALASYPWVYDSSHEKYKDNIMKRNSWIAVAQQLNLNGKIILLCTPRCVWAHYCMFLYVRSWIQDGYYKEDMEIECTLIWIAFKNTIN